MSVTVRPVTVDDAARLAEVLRANREFLAPWDPIRDDGFFTEDGQRELIRSAVDSPSSGPHVIELDGRVVGRVNLNNVVRGPFQSSSIGYWVSREANGRGVATAAVAQIVRIAFEELGLHRLEAGTLLHNTASQRVLERNGFTRFGLAPKYLCIAGRWQDHVLFQRINEG
ncbi:GNAT family protein [Actinoplanes sp. NPDC051633]|uniref:GNAT family N-acetyltransferase n=1 Tax=Actinoplanes sp. NPDC051633 TaxID=3155670 RepID=UPI0034351E35